MKLIYIYGPPAVGKLTVARELGRLTGLAVFDNHLSMDCVLPVFGIETPTASKLVTQIRHLVIEEAAREGVSLIFTFVYAHPLDTDYVERICGLVERHAGSVDFVQLTCDAAVQEQRVGLGDRVGRKLDSVEGLRRYMEEYDLSTAVPGRESLRLDTTNASSAETAARIAARLRLLPE
jgi:predicted kinase